MACVSTRRPLPPGPGRKASRGYGWGPRPAFADAKPRLRAGRRCGQPPGRDPKGGAVRPI